MAFGNLYSYFVAETPMNVLQSGENAIQKHCDISNFIPPDGGPRVRWFSIFLDWFSYSHYFTFSVTGLVDYVI
jgi:hypothetical protein